jgi:hypothetical protein
MYMIYEQCPVKSCAAVLLVKVPGIQPLVLIRPSSSYAYVNRSCGLVAECWQEYGSSRAEGTSSSMAVTTASQLQPPSDVQFCHLYAPQCILGSCDCIILWLPETGIGSDSTVQKARLLESRWHDKNSRRQLRMQHQCNTHEFQAVLCTDISL